MNILVSISRSLALIIGRKTSRIAPNQALTRLQSSPGGMSPGRDICHAGEGTLEANTRVRLLVLLSVLINIKLINSYFEKLF
jgi:hypothetical protein